MKRIPALILLILLSCLAGGAQIVNRLKVDDDTFQRYAWGRMQMYNPANLALADSIYNVGVAQDNFRYKCLGLSLEFPVRFSQGDYARMDEAVAEIKELLKGRADARAFYFQIIHEYCQYLIFAQRASDAMLEARAMERLAGKTKNAAGKMYAHRIVGLIQSYRSNPWLAIQNFNSAAQYCKDAGAEQELPNLLILIAQEYTETGDFGKAEDFCVQAETYQEFFPSLRIKVLMTRAFLYNARKDYDSFWDCYDALVTDPLYTMQTESDSRAELDVAYLRSRGLFADALAKANLIASARDRHALRHAIYADIGEFDEAYEELSLLMAEKDSIYIKVQNEDMAILDAEMNNAQLRARAQKLKAQNEMTILLGFLVMFVIAFVSILVSQWRLRQNTDQIKAKNAQMLRSRQEYRSFFDHMENENDIKLKIMLNRKANSIRL